MQCEVERSCSMSTNMHLCVEPGEQEEPDEQTMNEAKGRVVIETGKEEEGNSHLKQTGSSMARWLLNSLKTHRLEPCLGYKGGEGKRREAYRSTNSHSISQMSVLVIKGTLWSDPTTIIPGHFGRPRFPFLYSFGKKKGPKVKPEGLYNMKPIVIGHGE